ncbi:hypothetical protein FDC04_17920 [Clostridium botulinum]|nr:hypothetical protein [Clostridium botulinum]
MGKESINKGFIIKEFLQEPLYSYYKIDKYITDIDFIKRICSYLCLDDLINGVNIIYYKLSCLENKEILEEFVNVAINYTIQEIEDCMEEITVDDFTNDLDLNDYFNESSNMVKSLDIYNPNEYECMVIDYTIKILYKEFKAEIKDKFYEMINKLEVKEVRNDMKIYITNNINFDEYDWKSDITSYVETEMEPDYDDFCESHEEDNILACNTPDYEMDEFDEIESMFERDI